MDAKLVVSSILLLILMVSRETNGSTENEKMPSEPRALDRRSRQDMRIEQVHSHHMHHHMDPSLIVFFFLEDLRLGNTIPIHFPNRELSEAMSHSLSKTEADSIPFSFDKLHYLLQYFSLPEKSPQAKAMEDTLWECETKPIEGETKQCATSMESMLDFAKSVIGKEMAIEILSTSHITSSDNNVLLQKYTIREIREIKAPKTVACHTLPYPYTVFYCHYQVSKSRVYQVLLEGENKDRVKAVAVCHMDTSHWTRNHVSFQVLGVEPGSSPICHFFPADNLVWVPSVVCFQCRYWLCSKDGAQKRRRTGS